jgi:hypothetical protein
MKGSKMTKGDPLKECYGSYPRGRACSGCVYKDSCALYSRTESAMDRRSGLVSFDNTVDRWYPAPPEYVPGHEEENDPRAEMISMIAKMLKYLMKLDSYTLGIVAEMIAPSSPAPGGVTVAHLAKLRNCSRQAMHEKMLYAAARFPELGSLFQTALRRVGNLKSKFQRYSKKKEDK